MEDREHNFVFLYQLMVFYANLTILRAPTLSFRKCKKTVTKNYKNQKELVKLDLEGD